MVIQVNPTTHKYKRDLCHYWKIRNHEVLQRAQMRTRFVFMTSIWIILHTSKMNILRIGSADRSSHESNGKECCIECCIAPQVAEASRSC